MSLENCILIPNARLSFPHLAEPQKQKGDNNNERVSYSAELILQPNDPAWAKFHGIVNDMAAAKWKEKWPQIQQMIQADRKKRCFGWGQEKINQTSLQVYDGYPNMVFITAGNKRMPQMIQADGQGIDPMNAAACQMMARELYGGCRVNAVVKPWLQHNDHGFGIRCELISIQKAGDDTPFGEAVRDASALFQGLAGAPPASPGFAPPGAPPAAHGAPAWPQPQVGMPPAPYPGQQAPPVAAPAPAYAPPPNFGAPAPNVPPFLR